MDIDNFKAPNNPSPKRVMNPKSLENLKKARRWKPGESGNPKGKPPSKLGAYEKTHKYEFEALTRDEVERIEIMVLSADFEQLKKYAEDKDGPAYLKMKAVAVLMDMKKGSSQTIDKLRAQIFGEIVQHHDITSNGESINSEPLTAKQARDFLKELEEKY